MIAGIDFGTTNSIIAAILGGKPVVIPNSEGETMTPSVAAFDTRTHEFRVGTPAKRQSVTNPDNTVLSVKRLIGRKFTDSAVQDNEPWLPYTVTNSPNNDCEIVIGGDKYSPDEIVAMILRKLKADAEAYVGEKITGATIAVPAYFGGNQHRAMRDAAKLAELPLLRLISETAATSIGYWVDRKKEETVAVYRLGGGSFDISIVDTGEGVCLVRSTSGDTRLGGDDFDRRIVKWICDEFRKRYGIELCQNKVMLQVLWQAAEAAKCELSSVDETEINLPFVPIDAGGTRHFAITLARDKLEKLTADLVTKTLGLCQQATTDAEEILKKDNIKLKIGRVILVGGQTRMPLVQEKVKQFFREPILMASGESVARGAAVLAGVLAGYVKDILLIDATSHTLGVETVGGVTMPVIPRNTTIPTLGCQILNTAYDNQTNFEVHVLEGESSAAADNESIGRVMFQGVPPAAKGVPQIEVTFDIDANGVLGVKAKDRNTGTELRAYQPYLYI